MQGWDTNTRIRPSIHPSTCPSTYICWHPGNTRLHAGLLAETCRLRGGLPLRTPRSLAMRSALFSRRRLPATRVGDVSCVGAFPKLFGTVVNALCMTLGESALMLSEPFDKLTFRDSGARGVPGVSVATSLGEYWISPAAGLPKGGSKPSDCASWSVAPSCSLSSSSTAMLSMRAR